MRGVADAGVAGPALLDRRRGRQRRPASRATTPASWSTGRSSGPGRLGAVEDGHARPGRARRLRLGAVPAGRRGRGEPPAATAASTSAIGAFSDAHRPRLRGGRVHHERGEPGLLLRHQRQPGRQGRGLRRPGGHRGVPDGAGDPRVARAGRPAAADRRTTARSPAACSGSTTRRRSVDPETTGEEAADLITAVLREGGAAVTHHDAAARRSKTAPSSAPGAPASATARGPSASSAGCWPARRS